MECSGSPGVVLQETFLFCCFTVGQQCACAAVCTPVSQRFLLFADVGPETCSLRFFSSLSNTVGCCMAQTKTVFFPSPCRIQHHPTTTTPAAPPSQTPCSQRYSERSSNPAKRSHDSTGSISIPFPNPPQTAVIECLSELAPTTQLATPSQNQPAKLARQTQSAPPTPLK